MTQSCIPKNPLGALFQHVQSELFRCPSLPHTAWWSFSVSLWFWGTLGLLAVAPFLSPAEGETNTHNFRTDYEHKHSMSITFTWYTLLIYLCRRPYTWNIKDMKEPHISFNLNEIPQRRYYFHNVCILICQCNINKPNHWFSVDTDVAKPLGEQLLRDTDSGTDWHINSCGLAA